MYGIAWDIFGPSCAIDQDMTQTQKARFYARLTLAILSGAVRQSAAAQAEAALRRSLTLTR